MNKMERGLEPVLITDQWLKDSGFKKEVVSSVFEKYYRTITLNSIKLWIYKNIKDDYYSFGFGWSENTIAENRINFLKRIKYADQIKNLCFALTGKELIRNENNKKNT